MNSSHSVPFTKEELREAFKQMLSGPHKDLIAEAVVELISDSSSKTEKLVKSLSGIIPAAVHTLYDEYYVDASSVSSWQRDDTATKQAGLIDANNRVLCRFIRFEPWDNYQYVIRFEYVNKSGKRAKGVDRVNASQIILAEEFPEDF